MKAGAEGDIVRLTLEVDDLGNITPTAQIGGSIVTGEVVEIPNLYETHFVTAEARIDMAGVEVQPSGSIYEPMKPGQSVKRGAARQLNAALYQLPPRNTRDEPEAGPRGSLCEELL